MFKLCAYNFKALMEGGLTLMPGGKRLFVRGTTGTDSARYCYSVWMRHLINVDRISGNAPNGVVVELGPGDSLGIGLAALLTGATHYMAVDAVQHANLANNLEVFAELVELFKTKAEIPTGEEFPEIKPAVEHLSFPSEILSEERMQKCLCSSRLVEIESALRNLEIPQPGKDPIIRYLDPNSAASMISECSVNLVFSQAVLEHVDDLASIYDLCHCWLVPGGLMTHQIDFKSHGAAREWNGHWIYPELIWKFLRGRRPYFLNRKPCTAHLKLMKNSGFDLLAIMRTLLPSRLKKNQLSASFRNISDDDFVTAGAFVIARKCEG